jgi:hypothetical protein
VGNEFAAVKEVAANAPNRQQQSKQGTLRGPERLVDPSQPAIFTGQNLWRPPLKIVAGFSYLWESSEKGRVIL